MPFSAAKKTTSETLRASDLGTDRNPELLASQMGRPSIGEVAMTPAQRQARRKGAPAPAEGPASAARARLANAQAAHAEMKARILQGSLLDAGLVQAEWQSIMVAVRSALLAVPSRVAQVRPHLARDDLAAIDDQIRAALTRLADQDVAHLSGTANYASSQEPPS